MLRVYPASKLYHYELFLDSPQVFFQARWLLHAAYGTKETPENARDFWLEDFTDLRNADVVIVYGKAGDDLHGALIEAGAALAFRIPVVLSGSFQFGSWRHHPGVWGSFDTLDEAIKHCVGIESRLRYARGKGEK